MKNIIKVIIDWLNKFNRNEEKVMENQKKYVKFGYEIDTPYCNFDELGLLPIEKDIYFGGVEFKNENATLYFKDDFILQKNQSVEDLEKLANDKLFAIMLEILKDSNARTFNFYIDESRITNARHCYASAYSKMTIHNSANAQLIKSNGSVITKEENQKNILENNKNKMQNIIAVSNSNPKIQDKDKEKFVKLFQIKNDIIKYFILYSWLYELCGRNQKETSAFIKRSNTYSYIGKIKKIRKKDDAEEVEEDVFTYLRNLIGHSINDILTINDDDIIGQVEQYTNSLIKIILEKLNTTH